MRVECRVTPALIEAIIGRTIPKGWRVVYTKHRGGFCEYKTRRLAIPRPKHGYRALWVYLHELGHALRYMDGKFKSTPKRLRYRGIDSSSYEEMMAETIAMDMLRHFGLPILDTELAKAQANVRMFVRHERRLGIPIYEGVRKFAYH